MKKGFTIVEILVFLTLSATLAVGIIVASRPPINRQRYNTAVTEFQDFLEGIYGSVNNVQSMGDGRSDTVIYGKLITFGEKTEEGGSTPVYIYDIVGDVHISGVSTSSASTLVALRDLHASIFREVKESEDDDVHYEFVNNAEYVPNLVEIENQLADHTRFSGAVMVVRSPISGKVSTFVRTATDLKENFWINNVGLAEASPSELIKDESAVARLKNDYLFHLFDPSDVSSLEKDVDFCLFSEEIQYMGNVRRAVRLSKNAMNSSGVILMPTDGSAACDK